MLDSIPGGPSSATERPVEQVVVTFFDLPCLAVRAANGAIYLAIRDLCDALGVQLSAQLRRIRSHTQLRKGLRPFRVTTAGGFQDQEFLHLQITATWLLMINSARTAPGTRQRLDYLQEYLVQEVYAAFARLTGLPEHTTYDIEDLDDLRKVDRHIAALAEQQVAFQKQQEALETRQTGLETSQDKARDAWRELRVGEQSKPGSRWRATKIFLSLDMPNALLSSGKPTRISLGRILIFLNNRRWIWSDTYGAKPV